MSTVILLMIEDDEDSKQAMQVATNAIENWRRVAIDHGEVQPPQPVIGFRKTYVTAGFVQASPDGWTVDIYPSVTEGGFGDPRWYSFKVAP